MSDQFSFKPIMLVNRTPNIPYSAPAIVQPTKAYPPMQKISVMDEAGEKELFSLHALPGDLPEVFPEQPNTNSITHDIIHVLSQSDFNELKVQFLVADIMVGDVELSEYVKIRDTTNSLVVKANAQKVIDYIK